MECWGTWADCSFRLPCLGPDFTAEGVRLHTWLSDWPERSWHNRSSRQSITRRMKDFVCVRDECVPSLLHFFRVFDCFEGRRVVFYVCVHEGLSSPYQFFIFMAQQVWPYMGASAGMVLFQILTYEVRAPFPCRSSCDTVNDNKTSEGSILAIWSAIRLSKQWKMKGRNES